VGPVSTQATLDMDIRFGLGNVKSLYTAGSLMTVSSGLSKYKLHLVRVHEVGWEGIGTEPLRERGTRILN
jgi:hypothetical protein